MKLQDILKERLPISMILCGKRRSGKTRLLIELLNSDFNNKFERIIVFSRTMELDCIWNDLNIRLKRKVEYSTEYNETIMVNVMKSQQLDKSQGEKVKNILFVIDDFSDKLKSKKGAVLNLLASTGRHYGISYIICSQKYNFIDSNVRNNSDELVLFKISTSLERKAIEDDLENDDNDISQVINYCTQGYDYFLLCKSKYDDYFRCNLLDCNKLHFS